MAVRSLPSVKRSMRLLGAVTALTVAALTVTSTPAHADGGGQTNWGRVCFTPAICVPAGNFRMYVYGRGDQIYRIRTEFYTTSLTNWAIKYQLKESNGVTSTTYYDRDSSHPVTSKGGGSDTWNPDSFPARTGQACASLWSQGHRLATVCLGITPAAVVLRSSKSAKCLDVDVNGGGRDGSKVQLWSCNGKAQQGWRLDSNGVVRSVKYPSKCLDADVNKIGEDGTKVQIWACNGTDQQRWTLSSGGVIHNLHHDQCLDADLNTIGSNGTKVQLWRCNGWVNQSWR